MVAWFEATELGSSFPLYWAELCGPQYAQMRAGVQVRDRNARRGPGPRPGGFVDWLAADRFSLSKPPGIDGVVTAAPFFGAAPQVREALER